MDGFKWIQILNALLYYMNISEQPGRIFAIFVVGPYLIHKGYQFEDNIMIYLGILFILYELFWIINYDPKIIHIG
tara:strand:+ start:602 stop:826 length:225 start_codon:yes stop_codon:yes gene_type:complete